MGARSLKGPLTKHLFSWGRKSIARLCKVGDLVKVHKRLGPRRVAKLSRTKDGPYLVVKEPTELSPLVYEVGLVGGTGAITRVHADSLQPYYDILGIEPEAPPPGVG